ncbi:MAG: excinuclease ABC subunit UvrB [Planctomycetota bacterium]|nr:excinuclease ABC subunit UvrB [Planctomycetota bacterium]
MDSSFKIISNFTPTGDQPAAIEALTRSIESDNRHQVLLGATGTGKTFTMANVIERTGRPALIISHNKTLAAQLYEEMRDLFPGNAVSYFVSYYDYYQPEAYIPQRDIYIEKDAAKNDDLDRLRLSATSNLVSRGDTIIVSSVSCLFGLGSPETYRDRVVSLRIGQEIDRRELLLSLTDMQYGRNEIEFKRGQFRVRGDVIEIFPAYEQFAVRIEFFGDEIERLELIHPVSGVTLANEQQVLIFPAVHYVLPQDQLEEALAEIRSECSRRVAQLKKEGKLLESQRLQARTRYDVEMLSEVGYCPGVENYARHLEGRPAGSRPFTLLDYFHHIPGFTPDDWLVFIDESHVTVPQIRAMYNGDRARKQVLVDHGFRLPSCLDNRPLTFEEFESIVPRTVHVSATPGPWELEQAGPHVIEQIIRPTGLLDPVVIVRPAVNQVPDLVEACSTRVETGERVLVTVLTKRMAEDLTSFLDERGLRVRYLHSDIDTLDRLEILRDLREGAFDVLVGVNLLREGLDLPEVSLVCILDADKVGFLRSETSLIQTIGRAARNVNAEVIMYGDTVTEQMQRAIDETERRRDIQIAYNEAHGLTPETIQKAILRGLEKELSARRTAMAALDQDADEAILDREEQIAALEADMLAAADRLEFEQAADLRDRIAQIKQGETGERGASTGAGRPRSRTGITARGRRGKGT